jgi:hypothetical protein
MRSLFFTLSAGILALATALPVRAQASWVGTLADPAYRQFLSSPYSYRTFSAFSPGYSVSNPIPFGYQNNYVTPGYRNERITPYGYQSYYLRPGYGGTTVTPFGGSYYNVPPTVSRGYVPPQSAPASPSRPNTGRYVPYVPLP